MVLPLRMILGEFPCLNLKKIEINSEKLKFLTWLVLVWLSRCSTARGSSTGFSLIGPTKIEAHGSVLSLVFCLIASSVLSAPLSNMDILFSGLGVLVPN